MIARRNQERVISLGKGEVESSILSRSTSFPRKSAINGAHGHVDAHAGVEQRKNAHVHAVENRWSSFSRRSGESLFDAAANLSTAPYRHPYAMKDNTHG